MKYAYHLLVENVEIRRFPGKTEKERRRTYLVRTWICVILHYISNMHKKNMILEIKALENAVTMGYIQLDYGPLHVLWQVSFGCWVTWCISSWQEYYKSVIFFNFTKLLFLNDKIYSYTKKTIWHLAIWQNWCFGQFYHSKICKIEK